MNRSHYTKFRKDRTHSSEIQKLF